jgi:hypothetical protein
MIECLPDPIVIETELLSATGALAAPTGGCESIQAVFGSQYRSTGSE